MPWVGTTPRQWARSIETQQGKRHRKAVLLAWRFLSIASPVGNPSLWQRPAPPGYVGGRFRANWQFGPRIPANDIDTTAQATAAHSAQREAARVSRQSAARTFIVNNVPYARRLNEGWSKQAPPGWVDGIMRRVNSRMGRS